MEWAESVQMTLIKNSYIKIKMIGRFLITVVYPLKFLFFSQLNGKVLSRLLTMLKSSMHLGLDENIVSLL